MKRREKQYYTIGEVCEMFDIPSHTLRYWEKEFPQLKPLKKNRKRAYRPSDLEAVAAIKELLQDKGFKICGARKALEEQTDIDDSTEAIEEPPESEQLIEALSKPEQLTFREYVKRELIKIRQILDDISP